MKTVFGKVAVKKRNVKVETIMTDSRTTERTIIEQHQFKKELVIPTYPAINPETAFKAIGECYRLKSPHSVTVYLFLLTQLHRKEQNNEVYIEQTELVRYLNLSTGTISKAFSVLEDLNLILKIGKSKYKISPNMAWVGSHIDWAEELLAIKEHADTTKHIEDILMEEQ